MTDTSLQQLIDRTAITDLVSRLGQWLDEGRSDTPRAILTEDVTVATPGGRAAGIDHVVAQARRNHDYEHVQHVITNVLVDLHGDKATARANLVVTLAGSDSHSMQGERYRFDATRTPEGWRLSSIAVAPLWKSAG